MSCPDLIQSRSERSFPTFGHVPDCDCPEAKALPKSINLDLVWLLSMYRR